MQYRGFIYFLPFWEGQLVPFLISCILQILNESQQWGEQQRSDGSYGRMLAGYGVIEFSFREGGLFWFCEVT